MGSRQLLREVEPLQLLPAAPAAGLRPNGAKDVASALPRQCPSVSLLDANLRFIAIEGKPLACCGCSSGELAGRPFGQFLPPATAAYVRSRYRQALAGTSVDFEFPYLGNTYAVHADPIANERGDITAILAVARDVTEQQREAQAQQFLVNASTLLASSCDVRVALVQVANLAVPHLADWCLVCLKTGSRSRWLVVANANPALAAKAQARLTALGRIPSEIARLLTSDEPTMIALTSEEQLQSLTIREDYVRALRELVPCSAIFAPLVGHDGKHGGILFLRSDTRAGGLGRRFCEAERNVFGEFGRIAALAVENALLHEEAAKREQQLHDLVGRLSAAKEEERHRIACDVHDQLAQVASSAYQHLQLLADHYHPRSAAAKAALDQALELSRGTIREARRVVAGLRPAAVEDFGLEVAVGRLVDDLRAKGWEATYRSRLGGKRLPAPLESEIFLVAQEALSNVRKHAGPARVRVSLACSGRWVRLDVRDWGRGFETSTLPPSAQPGTRMGLNGMRARMAQVGGECHVRSYFGRGTHVVATAPLLRHCERALG